MSVQSRQNKCIGRYNEDMEDEEIMKKNCKVSIIMPSLNVADYIDVSIQSVLNQTLSEKEIICIDAGSTDGTWEKLLSYADSPKYKDQILLLQSNMKSYGYQINLALHSAVGEYVGIVETDDYIDAEMYKQLYTIGISTNADFVKADYDTFVTCPGNIRIHDHIMLFKNEKEKYGKVLNPGNDLYLYTNDHNIWNGIYKRKFLLNHNIVLNESKGAAFQDIGFTQQVLASAERAVYIDKSFYRYRMDREDSSINSIHGLNYSYGEFSRLLEVPELREKIIYLDGFFAHMVQSFCCELIKALRAVDYDVDSEFIMPYYKWFKEQILNAINSQLLSIDLYQLYPQLSSALDNIYKFSLKLKNNDFILDKKRNGLLNAIREKHVIVFGMGVYGELAIKYLYKHNIYIIAACDNNNALWNTKKYGLSIYSPSECMKEFSDCTYVIANQKNSNEIYSQLLDLGIKENNIFIYS